MLALKQKIAFANKQARGFSLIELMLVVAILGIMAGFAIPAFQTWMADTRTRTVAEALQNGLRNAQAEAVRRGVQVQFILTNDAPISRDVTASATGINWVTRSMLRATPATADAFIEGANLNAVSNTSLVSASSASVTFNSLGRLVAPANAVIYQIRNPSVTNGRKLDVRVSLAGRVRMCDADKTQSASTPDGCN
jgi:type IV fimbrial biogenesis protein FimT